VNYDDSGSFQLSDVPFTKARLEWSSSPAPTTTAETLLSSKLSLRGTDSVLDDMQELLTPPHR
jgi:hypothetical protein